MDDEDGRCLLDVICDPQALNDFLHGSDKIDGDDLLDNTGDAASAFFVGTGVWQSGPRLPTLPLLSRYSQLHVQEAPGNHLTTEPNPPTGGVDLDFLPDDILGSPSAAAASLANSDQPCDILQQSLQEANITEQTLEAEAAELDLGPFQLPSLQPVVQTAPDGTQQIFSGGADLIGLQQPAVLTHQALVQQSVGADVVNKAISVQPFIQQVGLGNVTIQPISNLPGLPNGSPGGALGIGQIQVVGQQVMAINQPGQQLIAKQVQPSQVANLPVGSYLAGATPEQQQVSLASSGVSPQNAGLVLQSKIPTVATTLNGSSMFGNVSTSQCTQSLTVTSSLNSPVIIQRTPTPIQPKPAGVLQQKLFQLSPKTFAPNNATLSIQGEAALQQQQKAQQNLTFMAGKPGQNVVLSGFPPGLPANVFKQPPPQQQALAKHMSLQLLNQGSSIVIPAQHAQAMLQGQNQFLLPGGPTVQQLSALQANMGGQILASHPSGQAHIIASQGPGGQLLNPQALPAQILTNQNLASQLNLGQVLTSQNAHGTAHILSGPIQLQAGQVGHSTLFQMPVSLASSLSSQSQPSVTTSLSQAGQAVLQGVAMFNPSDGIGPAVSIQQASSGSRQSPGIVQAAGLLSSTEQPPVLTVQTTQQSSQGQAQLQLNVQQQQPPQQPLAPPQPMASPSIDPSPDKIILSQAAPGGLISAESMQMFLQQKEQQQLYEAAMKSQQESSLVQTSAAPHLTMPIYSIAASGSTLSSSTSSSSSVPASVIVSSSSGSTAQPNRDPAQNNTATPESKGHLPHFPASQSQQAMPCQIPTGQQKLPGASPSHTLPHPPSPQLQATSSHHSQMQSPHQSRPPSRPPSRPHSRPPSQPQSVPRPPSEPLSRSCTPQMQNLFVIQNQISSSPHGSSQHPLRPPSQPQVQTPFPPHQPLSADIPQTLSSPQQHVQLQVQLSTPQTDIRPGVPMAMQGTPPTSDSSQTHSFPVQFQAQAAIKSQNPGQPIHITADQQRTFQMTPSQFQALALSSRIQQMQQGLVLPSQQQQGAAQTSPAMAGQYIPQTSSVLIPGQGQPVVTQAPLHGHSPGQVLVPSAPAVHGDLAKAQAGAAAQAAQLSTLLQQHHQQQQQQQASVVVKTSGAAAVPGPQDATVYPNTTGKPPVVQGKPITSVPGQMQGKPGVISSVPTISLGKASLQIQVVGKGMPQIVPSAQAQPQYESKFGTLKKLQSLQPSKEACFLEQLHKHQGSVLHPDYKTPFYSFEDALHRLLPYHVYQGLLPNTRDLEKVDDEFETVSTQLLKRTQAMLNKYRLLLLEESRRVSPSAEMVMIDRMFIQEEKMALSIDRQLAKDRPDEYVTSSSSSRAQTVTPCVASISSSPCPAPSIDAHKPIAVQTSTPIHPTKLVIKHSSGGSPSVTWAKASPSLDPDDDALPSRSKPPIKTYEARSRIGLKLKIKQEAGLSKVIHNTALDPVHHNPQPPPRPPAPPTAPASTVIKTVVNPTPAATTIPTGQMNGTLDHSSPAEKKPPATFCRLPLRKTYRENVDAFVPTKPADIVPKVEPPAQPTVMAQTIKQEDGTRSVITSHKVQGVPESEKKEESSKLLFYGRGDGKTNKNENTAVKREIKEEEPEFYRRVIKTEPVENEPELSWEMALPSAKRLKSEQFDVDNASFSSDSPQDDTLNEHLQSAIDSILNLQQPQSGGSSNTLLRSSAPPTYHHSSSSSPFSSPVHRTDSYLTPNHNGGLGARTLNR